MKFILTRELGRLAKWLRILGFDTAYFDKDAASSLIIQALREGRIIITRNQRIAQCAEIKTVLIKAEKLKEQIREAGGQLNLKTEPGLMFSRCILCNTPLRAMEKEKAKDRVPEYIFQTQADFVSCPDCQRIYWKGTHWGNVAQILEEIK